MFIFQASLELRPPMFSVYRSRSGRAAVLAAAGLVAAGLLGGAASANTYSVTNTSGDANTSGSFAYAITQANANPGSTINVDLNNYTMTSALPYISASVTINGNGVTVDGSGTYRPFFVDSGTVTFNDMSIIHGLAQGGNGGGGGGGGGLGAGGALFIRGSDGGRTAASVTLDNVTFSNNAAVGGHGGSAPNSGDYYGGGGGGLGGDGGYSGPNNGGGGGGAFLNDNGDNGAGSTGGNGGYNGGANGPGSEESGNEFQGGGGGAHSTSPYAGGNGGFGGGGGGAALGYKIFTSNHIVIFTGNGGFGGGGGGGQENNAGFGGGGGAPNGYTGGDFAESEQSFGGTAYANLPAEGGGGGAGLGGAVFVSLGATLNFQDSGLSGGGNTVTGGLDGAGNNLPGSVTYPGQGQTGGQGVGQALFIYDTQVQFTQSAGMTQTITQSVVGSNGGFIDNGAAVVYPGVDKLGAGTLVVSAPMTYGGVTNVSGGTMTLLTGGSITCADVNVTNGATLNLTGTSFLAEQNGSSDVTVDGTSTAPSTLGLADSTSLIKASLSVGVNGMGVVNQTGGTVKLVEAGMDPLNLTLTIGANAGSMGIYNQTGGIITAQNLIVGQSGNGVMNVTATTGGNNQDLIQESVVGYHNGSAGQVSVSGGAFQSLLVYVGFEAGSKGTVSVSNNGGIYTGALYQGQPSEDIYGSSGIGTLNVSNGGLYLCSYILALGDQAGGQGFANVSSSGKIGAHRLDLGGYGSGTLNQSGGVVVVAQTITAAGFTFTSLNGELDVGFFGQGMYNLSGGSLSADILTVGYGLITINYSNGTGYNSSTGLFLQTGGTVQAGSLTVGPSGVGTYNQSAGTTTVSGLLELADTNSGSGTYLLSGGMLTDANADIGASNSSGASSTPVAGGGVGIFNQTGGTHKVTGSLNLTPMANSPGSYFLSGNSAMLTAGSENIGVAGAGTFTQTGGSNIVGNGIIVGVNSGSTGTYSISGGTLMAASLDLGQAGLTQTLSGANGTLIMSGGSATVTGTLRLGDQFGASGSVILSGGTLTTNNTVVGVGGIAGGVGSFRQTGGTHSVANDLTISQLSTYNLTGGTLVAGTILGNDGGVLDLNGGTISPQGNNSNFISGLASLFVGPAATQFNTAGYNVGLTQSIQTAGGTDGGLNKYGAGTLTLSSAADSYNGGTRIYAGTLNLAGGGLAVDVTGLGPVDVLGGTLTGSGLIPNAINVGIGFNMGFLNSILDPGAAGNVITATSETSFVYGGVYDATLDPTDALTGQLITDGLSLDAGTFIFFTASAAYPPGTSFVVIDNTSLAPIDGRFADLSDGGLITVDGTQYRANYEGGTGNDLTLTAVPEPSCLAGLFSSALLLRRRRRGLQRREEQSGR